MGTCTLIKLRCENDITEIIVDNYKIKRMTNNTMSCNVMQDIICNAMSCKTLYTVKIAKGGAH